MREGPEAEGEVRRAGGPTPSSLSLPMFALFSLRGVFSVGHPNVRLGSWGHFVCMDKGWRVLISTEMPKIFEPLKLH